MRPTRQKRIVALLLALAAALTLSVQPSYAVRFQDVEDETLSLAVDTLAALGVVSGTGEGQFSPEGHLTRAELCKMAVELLGMREQAEAQAYRTIFTDMGKHWARGYVNVAATTQVPAESGVRLMLGLGNGKFGPDQTVTYQEAATLALRILGYGTEANRAWPHSAVETAAQLELNRDLGVEKGSAPITRGQTALLFYNMLTIPAKGEEEPCAHKLGKLEENSILLTTDATINGSSGWAVLAKEDGRQSYPCAGAVDQSLRGKRGWAMLDKEGRFVTLLPDESSSITAAVERKQAYYLHLKGQGRYTLTGDTPVYTGSAYDAGVTNYKEYMANLRSGDIVTLYLNDQGRVTGLYCAGTSSETRFLVVGQRMVTHETFSSLTGGERNYTVRKNGVVTNMAAIKQYDVATYNPVAKVLDVCDVRLSCIYENASPSPGSPSQVIAAGGNEFEVLADGITSFTGRKLGDKITLMFTADGKVAGILPDRAGEVVSAALGVAVGDRFQVLGCRLTLKQTDSMQTGITPMEICNAYSEERGKLTLERAGERTSAQLNTRKMTLDKIAVSSGAQIYERTADGLVLRDIADLPDFATAAQYHKNSAGQADIIILNGYTGDGIEYGRIDVLTGFRANYTPIRDGNGNVTRDKWTLIQVEKLVFTGQDDTKTYDKSVPVHKGYGSIVEYDGLVSVNYLQEITNVRSSAFFTEDGVMYVSTSKGVYPVDENVVCFNGDASFTESAVRPTWVQQMINNGGTWEGTPPWGIDEGEQMKEWFPGSDGVNAVKFDSLGECRNFSDTVNVYVDNLAQRVRVVESSK